jgi:hypothetical protein
MRVDINRILENAGGFLIGVTILGVLALVFGKHALKFANKQGEYSYNGLSIEQVNRIYKEMDSKCQVLSRTCEKDNDTTFCRGVYLGGQAAYPLYYRYEYNTKNGSAAFYLYPMIFEKWSTDPDVGGRTGRVVFPNGS